MNNLNYLKEVKDQYENYPYPMRNPEDEKKRLLPPIIDCLDILNHYGFGGKKDFNKNFRTLVAGGGTGDSLVFIAEQLRHTNAEVIYIDISEASMNIAKQRAQIRGLNNIKWHLESILNIPKMNLGLFDYINCSGVLHHLESPDEGLKSINSVLKEDGVMGLMVYGQYGRTGVYQIQELARLVNGDEKSQQKKVDNCKDILLNLPKSNWFAHSAKWFNDLSFGDIGIYDLFLHSQDRAYTIPELYEFLDKQNLNIVTMLSEDSYNPKNYIRDENFKKKIDSLDEKKKRSIAELLCGKMKTHIFYAAKNPAYPPSIDDLDMVPCLPLNTDPKMYQGLYNLVKNKKDKAYFDYEGKKVIIPYDKNLETILKYLDGKNSLGEIYKKAALTSKGNKSDLKKSFSKFYEKLNNLQLIFLRDKNTKPYKTVNELQQALKHTEN